MAPRCGRRIRPSWASSIDGAAVAERALAVGRRGSLGLRLQEQIDAWLSGADVSAVIVFDQARGAAYLQSLAATIDKPQFEATLGINGLEVTVQPGQIGRRVDIDATLMVIEPSVAQLIDADLPLVVRETPPWCSTPPNRRPWRAASSASRSR